LECCSLAPLPLHNVRQLRELLYAYKVWECGWCC
jgi:hypothetical protein